MPTKIEKDTLTGTDTTGHEWDGVKELNTPLPTWWVYTFWATIVFAVVGLFAALYPNVMPNIDRTLVGLDIFNASSTAYTLKTMTMVAVIFTPIVLAYQGWTYWVFRRRLSASSIAQPEAGTLDYVVSGR